MLELTVPSFIAFLILFFWSGFIADAALAEPSLRCERGTVTVDDTKRDVEDACGPPAFIDTYQEERTVRVFRRARHDRDRGDEQPDADAKSERGDRRDGHGPSPDHDGLYLIKEDFTVSAVEEWTYNFGPDRFVRTVGFRDDRLVSVADGDYGYDAPNRERILNKGDSKAVVYMKYGKPDEETTSVTYRTRINREIKGGYVIEEEASVPVRKDVWIYDRGPEKFLLEVTFKDNRLTDDRTLKSRGRKPRGK